MLEVWQMHGLILTLLWFGLVAGILKLFIGLRQPSRNETLVSMAFLVVGIPITNIISFILWG